MSQEEDILNPFPAHIILLWCSNFFFQLTNKILRRIGQIEVVLNNSLFFKPIIDLYLFYLSHIHLCLDDRLIKIFCLDLKRPDHVRCDGFFVDGEKWANVNWFIVLLLDGGLDFFSIKIVEFSIFLFFWFDTVFVWTHGIKKFRFRRWTA